VVEVPEVRYAEVDGLRIAWQQFGAGPDLLAIPPLVSNIEIDWEHEYHRRFFEHMGAHLRVTAFDKRGMGLSDRFEAPPTLEQRIADIAAVMDAAGLPTATVLGASEGGLMAQLFAAQHPDRVDRLVLVNSLPGASGFAAVHTDPDGSTARLHEKITSLLAVVEGWGTDPQVFVDLFSPCLSSDAAYVRWIGRLQRQSATASQILQQLESLVSLDAVERLADITAPTLVLQVRDDQVVPRAAASYLAERIPRAELVEFDGDDHIAFTQPSWRDLVDRMIEFVVGRRPAVATTRAVKTIVFTDIVGSTSGAAAMGDDRWRRLLDEHDQTTWRLADAHGGTIVKSTGDGSLACFDAPSAAVAFAADVHGAMAGLGLALRCGVHTGEVELRADGDLTGVAVNLAARIQQACEDGGVLVSSTVADLLLGGATVFTDRGEHELKGFARPWRLYALA
jgi:class 3 adenylate cyclase/predicted alpha/beta hydrolase